MALVLKDRVKETTTTTGTGTITLLGASTGYQAFSTIGNANTTYYCISGQGTGEWEVGIGTYTASGTTLSRDTILASSNSGSAVPFITGVKDVFVVYPAGRSVNYNEAGTGVDIVGTISSTGVSTFPAGTVSAPAITTTGDTNTGIYFPAADTIAFTEGGVEAMRIDSSGRVGIGTTSPAVKFVVSNSGANGYEFDPANSFISSYNRSTSAWTKITTRASSYTFNLNNSNDAVNIDSSGNVGIGTSSPVSLLDVNSASSSASMTVSGSDGLFAGLFGGTGSAGPALFYRDTSPALRFGKGTVKSIGTFTEQMRLHTSGGLSLGDTTDPGAGSLRVAGNATLGDASTDTVTVNGYMGVGVAPASSVGLYVASTALTSSAQAGIYSTPTANSAATASLNCVQTLPRTAAASFTSTDIAGFRAYDANKGAGSTITNLHGVYINDHTQGTNNYGITSLVTSGSNKWNIYASGTANNYFAGNVGIGTTAPSAPLEIFNNNGANIFLTANYNASVNGLYGRLTAAGADRYTLIIGGRVTDGSNYQSVSDILFYSQAASPTASSSPGYIVFRTTPSGSVTPTERMRIDSAGNVGIGVTPSAWAGNSKALTISNAVVGRRNNGASIFGHNFYESVADTFTYTQTGVATRIETPTGGGITFNTAASGTAGNTITFTQAMTLDASRNLLLGGTATPASAAASLAIFNGTAPTGSVANGIVLYAEDVSASSELKVRDEAGNVTTLSPHNFELIPEGPSEEMAWAYYSERGGKRINVDMLKLARMVEKLTGEKLVYTE